MAKRKTAGELVLKASSDNTKYDAKEIGHALVEDNSVEKGLIECIERHKNIFEEDEFFVGYVIASDPLIKGVMRRKFFAMLHLPSPRPEQAVFLYNKILDKITKRLWVLPAAYSENPKAWTMEKLYTSYIVPKEYQTMKRWSQYFYDGIFWESIRKEHNISHLSEHEYLNTNREKLVKSAPKNLDSGSSKTFDFAKISVKQIIDTNTAVSNESILDDFRKAQNA